MKQKLYKSTDCDLLLIQDKQIVIVGYGAQGRAFALNMNDSGCQARVALRAGSNSIRKVTDDWLEVVAPSDIINADIIVFAFPDHEQPRFYDQYLNNKTDEAQAIVLLHGSNFHFGNIKFDSHHDVILIAPHGPGDDLRQSYLSGKGMSCFLAVGQNASGKAKEIGLAIAESIGAGQAGIYETTFEDETIGDLFGEQVLLVGGLAGLTMAAFDKLVEQGLSRENAYLETVAQLKLLASMIEKHGPVGMIEEVSRTASCGSLMAMMLMFNEDFDKRLHTIYEFIASGEFNKFLHNEASTGFRKTREMIATLQDDECQKTVEAFNRNDRTN